MRVVVTGATGLVGQAVVRRFSDRGDRVVAVGRDLGRLQECFGEPDGIPHVVYCASDYGRESLEEAFAGADAVIHLAARRIAPPAEGLAAFWTANVVATENVVRAACSCGVATLCQASSISVYSLANRIPFSESEPPLPMSFYGISKLAGEHLAALLARQAPIRITSLRISRILGHDLTGDGYMLMNFIRLACEGRPLQVWGEGAGARDTVYVGDVVGAIEAALAPGAPGGVYNIGGGRALSNREIAETVNVVYGNQGNLVLDSTKAEDRSVFYMDCSRAATDLGWSRRYTLRSALEEMKAKAQPGNGG